MPGAMMSARFSGSPFTWRRSSIVILLILSYMFSMSESVSTEPLTTFGSYFQVGFHRCHRGYRASDCDDVVKRRNFAVSHKTVVDERRHFDFSRSIAESLTMPYGKLLEYNMFSPSPTETSVLAPPMSITQHLPFVLAPKNPISASVFLSRMSISSPQSSLTLSTNLYLFSRSAPLPSRRHRRLPRRFASQRNNTPQRPEPYVRY